MSPGSAEAGTASSRDIVMSAVVVISFVDISIRRSLSGAAFNFAGKLIRRLALRFSHILMQWSLIRCHAAIPRIGFGKLLGKRVTLKHFNLDRDASQGVTGARDVMTATVTRLDDSSYPAYVTFECASGSRQISLPTDIVVQCGDAAFASLAVTGVDFVRDLIEEMRRWDSPQAALGIGALERGFVEGELRAAADPR